MSIILAMYRYVSIIYYFAKSAYVGKLLEMGVSNSPPSEFSKDNSKNNL